MKKVTIAIVAAVLMSVSSVDAAASKKKPGMLDSMMGFGKNAVAGASKMGGQAVAGAKSMMGGSKTKKR